MSFPEVGFECTTHLSDMTCLWYFSVTSIKLVQWLGSISWSAGKTRCVNYIAKDPILLHVFVFYPWILVCHVMVSSQEECDVCFSVWGKQEKLTEDIYQLGVCQTVTQFRWLFFFFFRLANPAPGDLLSCKVNQSHLYHISYNHGVLDHLKITGVVMMEQCWN